MNIVRVCNHKIPVFLMGQVYFTLGTVDNIICCSELAVENCILVELHKIDII